MGGWWYLFELLSLLTRHLHVLLVIMIYLLIKFFVGRLVLERGEERERGVRRGRVRERYKWVGVGGEGVRSWWAAGRVTKVVRRWQSGVAVVPT